MLLTPLERAEQRVRILRAAIDTADHRTAQTIGALREMRNAWEQVCANIKEAGAPDWLVAALEPYASTFELPIDGLNETRELFGRMKRLT